MSRFLGLCKLLVALWGISHANPIFASEVTVPDDFTSIQAAIDSGADTVLIRDGTYPETPQAYRGVTLRGIGVSRPRLGGLAISNPYGWLPRPWSVRGIDFTGRVEIATDYPGPRLLEMRFTECALDSGLQHVVNDDPYDILELGFVNCRLSGPCNARAAFVIMQSDTIDVGVSWSAGDSLRVANCWFRGGPGTALAIDGDNVAGVIANNLFEDYAAGIFARGVDRITVASNVIRRMRGAGMDMREGAAVIVDNVISDCELGLFCDLWIVELYNNTCVGMRTQGMWLGLPDYLFAERNVVGRCGGSAMTVVATDGNWRFLENTLFNNAGSGIELVLHSPATYRALRVLARNNIVFGNSGWGLRVEEPQASVTLGCNDWYANGLGSVEGAPSSPEDLSVDPLFCNVAADDVTLFAGSPLVTQATCGQIGAKGVGCSITATTLTRLNVTAERDGIVIHWGFGVSDPVETWVERAVQESGPWDSLGSGSRVTGDEYVLRDIDVAADQVYLYRVAWLDRGTIVHSAPVSGKLSSDGPLSAITPNPSHGGVEVDWALANSSETEIRVFDLAGREVASVVNGRFPAGRHRARWDGRNTVGNVAAAGWYVVRVARGTSITSHRVLLIR